MTETNVFMLSRTTQADGDVHCGIRLLTNGGTVINSDDSNCVCVYFQSYWTGIDCTGHWEAVQDKDGLSRWPFDHPTVRDCLWSAAQKMQIARSVHDARKKQLTAAANRVNLANETIEPGDLAWITVPQQLVSRVQAKQKRKRDQAIAAENKMLVRIIRVSTTAPTELCLQGASTFTVRCQDGEVEGSYPIDMLRRCHPPPEADQYPIVRMQLDNTSNNSSSAPAKAPIKLSKAYAGHVRYHCTRAAINQANAARAAASSRSKAATTRSAATATAERLPSPPPSPSPSAAPVRSPSTKTRVLDVSDAPEGDVEHPQFPCRHCNVTMEWVDYVFCHYRPCSKPFHRPGVGCTGADKVVRVDEQLLYCRHTCAVDDRRPMASVASLSSRRKKLTLGPRTAGLSRSSRSRARRLRRPTRAARATTCRQPRPTPRSCSRTPCPRGRRRYVGRV
jgi:hypothetical protein